MNPTSPLSTSLSLNFPYAKGSLPCAAGQLSPLTHFHTPPPATLSPSNHGNPSSNTQIHFLGISSDQYSCVPGMRKAQVPLLLCHPSSNPPQVFLKLLLLWRADCCAFFKDRGSAFYCLPGPPMSHWFLKFQALSPSVCKKSCNSASLVFWHLFLNKKNPRESFCLFCFVLFFLHSFSIKKASVHIYLSFVKIYISYSSFERDGLSWFRLNISTSNTNYPLCMNTELLCYLIV